MTEQFSWQDSLKASLAASGARDPEQSVRSAQLATVTVSGIPDVRTIIIRGIDGDDLTFNTDRRSAKARHIGETPWVAVSWYIPTTQTQYRLYGMAAEAPELAERMWAGMRPVDRRNYLGPPPGKPLKDAEAPVAEAEDQGAVPESFMPVKITVEQADVLIVGDPHHRWSCARRTDGSWRAVPVVP